MGCSFTNLERAQRLMSTKSTSDFIASKSTGDKLDVADASGCLSYINTHYHDDDKPVMQIAVDCYVYNRDRAHLHCHLVQLAMTAYKTPTMRQKYANTMAQIVGDEILGKTKTDAEKAGDLGVSKSGYCQYHAHVFDAVFSEIFKPISKADNLAGQYWWECKLT